MTAAAVNGKIVIGLDTQNGMLLPYAGHELFHILKQNKNSSATAKELQAFIIDVLKNDASYNYGERFNELQNQYKFKGTDAEIADMINEEIAANACFTVLSSEKNFKSLVNQNKSLAQRVYDFFADFLNQIRERLVNLSKINAEYRALENETKTQDKIVSMMKTALKEYSNGSHKINSKKIKFSKMNDLSFEKNVDNILSMNDETAVLNAKEANFVRVLNHTPNIILNNVNNAEDIEMIIRFDALYLASRNNGVLRGHYHNLGADVMKNLPKYINEPDAIIKLKNGRLNLIAEMQASKEKNGIISIELNTVKDINSKFNKYNLIVSVFASKDNYLKNNIFKNAETVEYKKEDLLQVNPQLYEWLTIVNNKSSNTKIPQTDTDVNNNSMQDNAKYSLRDSDGNELSKKQQEYFKNSKVRDKNGNLLVMYHETPNKGCPY